MYHLILCFFIIKKHCYVRSLVKFLAVLWISNFISPHINLFCLLLTRTKLVRLPTDPRVGCQIEFTELKYIYYNLLSVWISLVVEQIHTNSSAADVTLPISDVFLALLPTMPSASPRQLSWILSIVQINVIDKYLLGHYNTFYKEYHCIPRLFSPPSYATEWSVRNFRVNSGTVDWKACNMFTSLYIL